MKAGDPARIQLIYERALAENCLVPDLWARYNQYLVRKEKKKSLRFYFPCGFLFMSSPDLTWHRVIVCSAPPFCFEGVH